MDITHHPSSDGLARCGMRVLCKVAGAKSRNSVIVTPPEPQSHHNVTIPIRVNPRFAREERGSENPSGVKTLGTAVHDNALISKSDRGTSHTFFFFFMDGTGRIKLGGR